MDAAELEHHTALRRIFIDEANDLLADFEQTLLHLKPDEHLSTNLNRLFRAMHSVKGSGASVGFDELSKFAHGIEDLLTLYREWVLVPDQQIQTLLLNCVTILSEWITLLSLDGDGSIAHKDAALTALQVHKHVDVLKKQGRPSTPFESHQESQTSGQKVMHPISSIKIRPTLKVDVDRVDSIMDLCGELVVIKSQLEEHDVIRAKAADSQLNGILSLLGNTIRDVYESAMGMRMVSLKPTVLRLERAVRDTAVRLGKEIDFSIEGEDLELDRTIIEQLGDPLMHLCRNAVDHGIEDENLRRSAGKPSKGTLKLKAFNEGSNAVIELIDDGGGMNRGKIYAKAKEKGLVSTDISEAQLSDQDIFGFLFSPGFSTAAVVTDISGRGVGLDVVRSNVRAMKGDVTIQSVYGQGSTFRIVIPLSTALTDGIVVRVCSEHFIFPIDIVSEFVAIQDQHIQSLHTEQQVLLLREHYLPAVRLADLFGLSTNHQGGIALITRGANGPLAVIVDSVLGQSQIVMKKIDDAFHSNPLIAGAAVMGNGRVILVVDTSAVPGHLITAANQVEAALSKQAKTQNKESLVVVRCDEVFIAIPISSLSEILPLDQIDLSYAGGQWTFQNRGIAVTVGSYQQFISQDPQNDVKHSMAGDRPRGLVAVIGHLDKVVGISIDAVVDQVTKSIHPFDDVIGFLKGFSGVVQLDADEVAYVLCASDFVECHIHPGESAA